MLHDDAVHKCKSLNSRLYEPRDPDKYDAIFKAMKIRRAQGWLGITNLETQGKSVWTYDSDYKPLNFTNWNEGKPSYNVPRQFCVEVFSRDSGELGKWNNIECVGHHSPFTCETVERLERKKEPLRRPPWVSLNPYQTNPWSQYSGPTFNHYYNYLREINRYSLANPWFVSTFLRPNPYFGTNTWGQHLGSTFNHYYNYWKEINKYSLANPWFVSTFLRRNPHFGTNTWGQFLNTTSFKRNYE